MLMSIFPNFPTMSFIFEKLIAKLTKIQGTECLHIITSATASATGTKPTTVMELESHASSDKRGISHVHLESRNIKSFQTIIKISFVGIDIGNK